MTTSTATIGAVVVAYNPGDSVVTTLDALRSQTGVTVRVVVVDNGSTDGTAALVASRYPEAQLIVTENRGYGAAANTGVSTFLDAVDAVLVLTHECRLAPDALALLTGALQADASIGVVGPIVRRLDDDEIWSAGAQIDRHTWNYAHRHEVPDAGVAAVDWLDGCALVIRPAAWRSVGGMAERFFLYFEDVDLCLRLAGRGWGVAVVSAAEAWQLPGATRRAMLVRNHLVTVRRHGSWTDLVRVLAGYVRQINRRHPIADETARGVATFLAGRDAKSLVR